MNQKGASDEGQSDNSGQCVANYFQAGECKTSFRFQTRHIMRDVGIEKENNKLDKPTSRLFQISRGETMTSELKEYNRKGENTNNNN